MGKRLCGIGRPLFAFEHFLARGSGRSVVTGRKNNSAPDAGIYHSFTQGPSCFGTYLGVLVEVELDAPFLLFLPPLWPFFPALLVFSAWTFCPGGRGCGFNSVLLLSPPVCARARPVARKTASTIEDALFILFLLLVVTAGYCKNQNPKWHFFEPAR